LIINLFHHTWPKLAVSGYLQVFPTPLIVSFQGAKRMEFMTTAQFDAHAANNNMQRTRYFKGLGSWTTKDTKELMKDAKVVSFVNSEHAASALKSAFGKDDADIQARKAREYTATNDSF